MASGNNSSGGLIAAIIMFVLFMIAAVIAYMQTKAAATASADAIAQTAAANEANASQRKQVENVSALKEKIGLNAAEVGATTPGPDTVLGSLDAKMTELAGDFRAGNVVQTMTAMRTELDRRAAENADLTRDKAALQAELNKLRGDYQGQVTEFQSATRDAKGDLEKVVRETDGLLQRKDDEIKEMEAQRDAAISRAEQIRRDAQDYEEEAEQQINDLDKQLELIGDQLAGKEDRSFDKADGKIIRTDPTQGLVYLNLGSADGLTTETTFSVYKRNNAGIGRGVEDVKGAIEVIRILDDHFSEARITDNELSEPIGTGDLLFSPLWEAGRKNYFSFVGELNINADSKEDSALLFSKIRDEGGDVEVYVNAEGERMNGRGEAAPDKKLSGKTKYLVIGELPDQADYPSNSPEYEFAAKVLEQAQQLRQEARQQGIRTINLPDFVSFIGYSPTQRLFIPGDERSAEALRR